MATLSKTKINMIRFEDVKIKDLETLTDDELLMLLRMRKQREQAAVKSTQRPSKDVYAWELIDEEILEEQHPNRKMRTQTSEDYLNKFLSREQITAIGFNMWCKLEQLREFKYNDVMYVIFLNSQKLYSFAVEDNNIKSTHEVNRKDFIPCLR